MTSPEERNRLSHNLVREWVRDALRVCVGLTAVIQSDVTGVGVAMPQYAGEHNEPIDKEPPLHVDVHVTVPRIFGGDRIDRLTSYLLEAAKSDPRLGGRFDSAYMRGEQPVVASVDSVDLGPDAKRITYSFSADGPHGRPQPAGLGGDSAGAAGRVGSESA